MTVITKDGTKKKYKLTLKMMKELGYAMRTQARWHDIEYNSVIEALETVYPQLKNNIERAYL